MTKENKKSSGCFRLLLRVVAAFVILAVSIPVILFLPLNKLNPYVTSIQVQRCVGMIVKGEKFKYERSWTQLNNISRYMRRAVIAAEDAKFFQHDGIDFEQAEDAIDDYNDGRRMRGASTISMQLVKNLYLWEGATKYDKFFRKGVEIYLTLWLELLLPKDRILEIYLNVVEWGRGIYGVESAAKNYYRVSAKDLSRGQAAHLAAVLPSPLRHNPRDHSRFTERRAARILARM